MIKCVLLLVVLCSVGHALQGTCSAQFKDVRMCVKATLMKHVQGMTKAKSDRLGKCAVKKAKECITAKFGLFIAVIPAAREAMKMELEDIEIGMKCAVKIFEPYADDLEKCVAAKHPDMDIADIMEEVKTSVKGVANNDPKLRVLALSLLMVKVNDKLKCAAMLKCASDENVDLAALQSDVCAAGDRCYSTSTISNTCKDNVSAVGQTTCVCVENIMKLMEKQGTNPIEKVLECVASEGVTVNEIAKMLAQFNQRQGNNKATKDKMCGRDAMDGSMGFCAKEK